MKAEPIPGLSDQRYFHVALLSRKRGLSLNWIWNTIEQGARLEPGRLPSLVLGEVRQECRTVTEALTYAGSPESMKLLATPENSGTCDYDLVGAMTNDFVMFGSGYSKLTHDLVKRLVRQKMMARGWFLNPKLTSIAEMFQRPTGSVAKKAGRLDVALSATGLTAMYRGCKNFRGLRFAGADVFGEGFMEVVTGWLEKSAEKIDSEQDFSEPPFAYKMMRINAVERTTGGSAAVTMRPDGSYKFWLRKGGANLPEFSAAMSALFRLGLLEERADVPKWAEDEEL